MTDRPHLRQRTECHACHKDFMPPLGKEWYRLCRPCYMTKSREKMVERDSDTLLPNRESVGEAIRRKQEERRLWLVRKNARPPLFEAVHAEIAAARKELILLAELGDPAAYGRIRRIAADQRRLWLPRILGAAPHQGN